MKKAIVWLLLATAALMVGQRPGYTQDPQPVRIGILVDGPWVRNEEVLNLVKQEIAELVAGEFSLQFPPDKTITSDWTADGVQRDLDRLLRDPEVNFIITLGIIASHYVCLRSDLTKPVIAPVVVDADLQSLPQKDGASGVKNLSYLDFPDNITRDLQAFLEVVRFEKVALVFNKHTHDAISGLSLRTQRLLQGFGLQATIIDVDKSIDEVFEQLPADVEAVYVAPLLHLPAGEFDRLVEELKKRRLPSFSLFGEEEVRLGLLASVNTNPFPRLSRRIALNVQRILLGEEPGEIPTSFPRTEQLTINIETARAIGVYPSWGVMTEAELVGTREAGIERVVSLEAAVDQALAANLDLGARQEAIRASEQDIAATRAALLPQIDLSLLGLQIDKDRAQQSAGQQAERTLTGSVTLNQILYSDPAWANHSIQKHLHNTRIADRDALKLDIAQEAATAYLNVLRANTFERIQKDNLKRTRSNLGLARLREAIGTARLAEVLRWESQIANNRQAVIDANTQRNLAEIQLNRLRHRPAEEPFMTEDVDLNDSNLLLSQGRLVQYIDNPWNFKIFRTFMVKEGIDATPEIRAFEEAIAARERALSTANRSFWLPDVGLAAGVDYVLTRDGEGSSFDTSGFPSPLSSIFQEPEDLSWSVAVSANYALFAGGAKFADRSRAIHDLADLRLQLRSTAETVEQRIRSALHTMGASYAGIEQTRLAADAARRTLELVEDAYARGAATILDLLDAQNNALVADEAAANAIYDFLIDLMEAERSVGKLVLQMTPVERDAFFDRMDRFFTRAENPE
ncbi:MAG: TolC family protein [Candidatus Krumholzibacteria bacterium]|nr:TolC family protein [Candidatus Krumholzibacteria bacterium]